MAVQVGRAFGYFYGAMYQPSPAFGAFFGCEYGFSFPVKVGTVADPTVCQVLLYVLNGFVVLFEPVVQGDKVLQGFAGP